MNISVLDDFPQIMKESMPIEALDIFRDVYNTQRNNGYSDAVAFQIAWLVIKSQFINVEGYWVSTKENKNINKDVSLIQADLIPQDNGMIINATGDEITFEGILADTSVFLQDAFITRKFSEEALKDLELQINTHGSSMPDVDHEHLNTLVNQFGDNYEMIMNAMPKQKGLIKSIKAVYKEGKLWIKGVLDSRYKKIMKNVKGMSIEALTEGLYSDNKTIKSAKYLGFTFAINHTPKISGAQVTAVM